MPATVHSAQPPLRAAAAAAAKHVAVLARTDARINVCGALGLNEGEAHVIHHTDCGMLTFTDDGFKKSIQEDVGVKPVRAAEAFSDLDDDVRQSVARIRTSPFIPKKDSVRGFVFDVATGKLTEVS